MVVMTINVENQLRPSGIARASILFRNQMMTYKKKISFQMAKIKIIQGLI